MRKNFNSVPMLETSEVCDKFSKSVSYETLVGGTATTGSGYKHIRRLFLSTADKPLSAVGTLTSLLCNSAKVVEKLLHRHSEPKAKNPKKTGTVIIGRGCEPIISAESLYCHARPRSDISAESKRDPRLIATQSPRMTGKALSFLRLRGASGAQGISAPASCRKAHKRRFLN